MSQQQQRARRFVLSLCKRTGRKPMEFAGLKWCTVVAWAGLHGYRPRRGPGCPPILPGLVIERIG